ncbi:hypothetical protein LUZ60_013092 [Juncus effusus]|nr:hypothetical protein LUZ60_013092 [Juncus effusus]
MAKRDLSLSFSLFLSLLCFNPLISYGYEAPACEFSAVQGNTLYNYSLASPSAQFPHGILSQDGFYKVAVNDSILWFQLCDQMIFNHDQPACFDCQECGGPSRCGMTCSALVSNNLGGYDVCTTIGKASNTQISLIDESNPKKGVLVKMVYYGLKSNCSLSVSVLCDSSLVKVSSSFNVSGTCDYMTEMTHPSGCAISVAKKGNGLGWFGTLLLIIICLFGAYILVGTIYRYFYLRIHSLEAIPNLEFWVSLPQKVANCCYSLKTTFSGGGSSQSGGGSRATYAPMNYEN